ncbi:hypothetical protein [Enterococcus gilvus]|uniref:hypothetical protein n=1 Tax=Enterococcus gilvus TaxID=160453 RepID=UPI0005D1FB52|nr:hypothetical protein [Enterococcus gilvus]MBS5819760.1 hypothetical protein [Enterococcus gilvus]
MRMIIGIVFLLLGIWQLWMTVRTFKNIKKEGNENTSPFIMLSLWGSIVMVVIFLSLAINLLSGAF